MISVTHFDVAPSDESFVDRARTALEALAACPGYLDGQIGRSPDVEDVDAPEAWVLLTRWADVGSYRRALGNYTVKMTATPLLAQARNLPSAFEELLVIDGDGVAEERSSGRP